MLVDALHAAAVVVGANFRFGAKEAEVIADDSAEVPAVVMVYGGCILETLDANIEFVLDDGADIGFQIGLAVPGHGGRSNC